MLKKILYTLTILFLTTRSFGISKADNYHYFYSESCSHCIQVAQYFSNTEIEDKYNIHKYEIFQDPEALKILQNFTTKLNIPLSAIGTPFLVIESTTGNRDTRLSADPIIAYFEALQNGTLPEKTLSHQPHNTQNIENLDQTAIHHPLTFLSIMIPMAIADSINPCAFAVMLLLLSTILSKSKSRKKAFLAGILFSGAVFLSYVLIGIGVLKLLGGANTTLRFKRIIGILWILIGLANIKDYFRYGQGFLMEVPISRRPKMMKLIQSIISPQGAFGIGILVSLFLLPCSAGPYITILGLLKTQNTASTTLGISYLMIYNLLFILPMLIITIIISSGHSSVEKLAKLKNKNTKLMHLLIGILMLLLGSYIIISNYRNFSR